MKKEFKYLIIGIMIIGWSVFSFFRNNKRRTEEAEIEDDLNRYLNGYVKYDSVLKAIQKNGKGWWISNSEFNKQPSLWKKCALNPKCFWRTGAIKPERDTIPVDNNLFMFGGNDTNERMPTIEDIKSAKIVLIGVTEGVSFHAEFNKYPGRSLDGFWKLVNKNVFILGRIEQLMEKPSITGKRFDKKTLRRLAKKYSNLEMNNATEILLGTKTIQQIPG